VNGGIVNIPSYQLKPGDIISVREKSKSNETISDALAQNESTYDWLEWDINNLSGVFLQTPERENIPEPIKEQLIVELYSK
jgi:small subunit ribosomal protein S4